MRSTSDIDANGIVSVTAKDLGTGKEQKITITASTNMSKEDIDRAVREAEQYAEEDRLLREAADTKNRADSLVFQVEKTLSDLGDKLEDSEKGKVRAWEAQGTTTEMQHRGLKAGTIFERNFCGIREAYSKRVESQAPTATAPPTRI